jgi:regulator of cell morphogenesis and NO signaling
MPLSADKTVGEIAAAFPAGARVLEKHHIDYYSERSNPFREACRVAGVSAEEVLEEVRRSSREAPEHQEDWNAAPLADLIQYLKDAHQCWLTHDLPWIDHLIGRHLLDRKASVSEQDRSIPVLQRVFLRLRRDLEQHLRDEENVLFPAILELERARAEGRGGPVPDPILMIEQDHEIDAQLWDEMREIAYGYVTGEDAPQGIRALYQELSKLESAVHEHTHLENNVLFPRVIRLAQQKGGQAAARQQAGR